jgi:hypothetical protein
MSNGTDSTYVRILALADDIITKCNEPEADPRQIQQDAVVAFRRLRDRIARKEIYGDAD